MIFVTRLINKKIIAKDTMSFEFQKPYDFKFEPGQFILIKSIEGEKELQSVFSIASTPSEDNIMIAMRMRDSLFKNWLNSLNIDSEVEVNGPKGKFILPEVANKPIVFLAGGIGITPIRAMILHAFSKKFDDKIFLFYSNRTKEDIVFYEDFLRIKESNLIFIPTLTRENDLKNWNGEIGRINNDMIVKYVRDVRDCYYYIAGPPEFVNGMMEMVSNYNVKEEQIKKDIFTGYAKK